MELSEEAARNLARAIGMELDNRPHELERLKAALVDPGSVVKMTYIDEDCEWVRVEVNGEEVVTVERSRITADQS